MNFLKNTLQSCRHLFGRPTILIWLIAGLGLASTISAGWGLLRVTNLSAQFENHDDKVLAVAVSLKEKVAAYSKLTYDFLLQQDYSKMMVKEKQSNATRAEIEQNLAQLAATGEGEAAHTAIEGIRYDVTQFLLLTDKAFETAAEDGSPQKARGYLQDQVEPAFKSAEDALSQLIYSRQQFDSDHFHRMRQLAFMIIALLTGMTTLGVAVLLSLRKNIILNGHAVPAVSVPVKAMDEFIAALGKSYLEDSPEVKARSLAALAFANRLSRVRKESDDLKKLLQGLYAFAATGEGPAQPKASEHDVDTLMRQGEKIHHAVSRIQHIHDQSKQFVEKLGEMMNNMQKLATDGNVVALNVTIELAKLQAAQGGEIHEDKNRAVSEQIRAIATSAAAITGKLAMVLSQFKYTQEDFARHAGELLEVRNHGAEALERVRGTLQVIGQSVTRHASHREELAGYLPSLEKKMTELENQISQLQSIYAAEIEAAGEKEPPSRSFKVIDGKAA